MHRMRMHAACLQFEATTSAMEMEPKMEPNDAPGKRAADSEATGKEAAKKPRTESAGGAAAAAMCLPCGPCGPTLAEKGASTKVGVEMRVGMQLEVRWVLEEEDEETGESESEAIWWTCTLGDAAAPSTEEADGVGEWAWAVTYDAMEDRGFEEEERTVAFQTKHLLVDLQTRRESASSGGGGEEGLMQWRVAGDEHEPAPLLQLGMRVKARWQGREEFHAGRIAGLNLDGTYTVDYSDGQLETSVARDLIEVVEVDEIVAQSEEEDGGASGEDGGEVMGTAAMFDMVIGRLVRGPTFSSLPSDKQRHASDKIAVLKALFEEELDQLKSARGAGSLVTQQDVMTILPKILAASTAQQ